METYHCPTGDHDFEAEPLPNGYAPQFCPICARQSKSAVTEVESPQNNDDHGVQ